MSKAEAEAAEVFAALGDPTRAVLVATLSDGRSRSLSDLAHATPMSRQAVTKHLRVLEAAGLVASARAGRETRFRFRPERLDAMRAYLARVEARWDDALARLKDHVERDEG